MNKTDSIIEKWIEIWQLVLGTDDFTLKDRILDLGADSLMLVEIASLARRTGLIDDTEIIFNNPSISDLANNYFESENNDNSLPQNNLANQLSLNSKPFPLLPTQYDILSIPYYESFTMNPKAYWLDNSVRKEELAQALHALLAHHQALRVRIVKNSNQIMQAITPFDKDAEVLEDIVIHEADEEACKSTIAQLIYQKSKFHIESENMFRTLLVCLEKLGKRVLIFITHHIILDGFSEKIIHEDFRIALNLARRGMKIQLEQRPQNLEIWSHLLNHWAEIGNISHEEKSFWYEMAYQKGIELPKRETSEAFFQYSFVSLTKKETDLLRKQLRGLCNLPELLLTLITDRLFEWTGKSKFWFDMVSNGRSAIKEEIDITQTVGCLYWTYPLLLERYDHPSLKMRICAVRQQLRQVPRQGLGFAMLRWLSQNPKDREILTLAKPMVSFNYEGQKDLGFTQTSSDGLLETIPYPDLLWSLSRHNLAKQIAVPLRFFFYMRDGSLAGHALGHTKVIDIQNLTALTETIISKIQEIYTFNIN